MDSVTNHIFKESEHEMKPVKKEGSSTESPPPISSDSSSSIQSSRFSNPPESHDSLSSLGMQQGFTASPQSSTTSGSPDSSAPSDSSGTPIKIASTEFHVYAYPADSSSTQSYSSRSSSSSGSTMLQDSTRQPRSLSPSPPSFGSPPYNYPSPPPHTSSPSSSHRDANGNSPPPSPFPSPSPPPLSPPRPARQGFLLQGIHLPHDVDTLCDAAAMAQLLIQDGDLGRFTGFKSPLAKRIARRLVGFLNEPYMWNEGADGGERVRCEEARSAVLDLVGCEHYDVRAVKLLGERVEWIRPAPIIERIVGGKGGSGLGVWARAD